MAVDYGDARTRSFSEGFINRNPEATQIVENLLDKSCKALRYHKKYGAYVVA
jgi:hypothetical protein